MLRATTPLAIRNSRRRRKDQYVYYNAANLRLKRVGSRGLRLFT